MVCKRLFKDFKSKSFPQKDFFIFAGQLSRLKKNQPKKFQSQKPASEPVKKKPFLNLRNQLALLCAAVALLLYSNTLRHDYTVDDATVMAKNTITTKGIKALPEIFSSAYRKGFWERKESLYRPLSVAMFAVEWQLAPNNPHLGHFINVILYALSGYVLCIALFKLFPGSYIVPFFAALLFIVHPVHTEVVANIKSRDEILAFLFSALSVFLFLKYFDEKKTRLAVLSGLCFLLALLSKESAITLVLIFPLVLYFFRKAGLKTSFIKSILLFAAAGIYLAIRFSVLHGISNFTEILPINNSLVNTNDWLTQKATAVFILGKYVALLFFPAQLSFDYSFNQIANVGFANGSVLAAVAVFTFLLFYALYNFSKRNVTAFGILFFFITISIVSNIFFLIESVMAERFLYMPSLGFSIAVVFFLSKVFKVQDEKKSSSVKEILAGQKLFSSLFILICVLFSAKTFSRNADWKNNITLLNKDVKTCPNSARIRYAYGSALLIERALIEKNEQQKQSYLDQSIAQLEKGVSILNTYSDAYYHLGIAYKEKGNYKAAVYNFEQAAKNKKFNDAEYFIALGISYGKNKQYEKSIETLNRAVTIDPQSTEAYNNLGVYYDEWGKINESIQALDKAISLDKTSDKAYYNLGNTYAHTGNYAEAINQYMKAIALKPGNIDALNNIGNSFAAMKDYNNAILWYKKTLTVDPSNTKALNNLGITYIITGNKEEGERLVKQANGTN